MPLFMFVSGWLTYGKENRDDIYVTNKVVSRILPFFFWAIFGLFVSSTFNIGYLQIMVNNLWLHPDSGLWFLWVVALCEIWFYLSNKISIIVKKLRGKNDIYNKIIGFVIILLVVHFIERYYKYGGMELLHVHLKWFFIGNLCCTLNKEHNIKLKKVQKIIVIILFFVLSLGWSRPSMPFESIISVINVTLIKDFVFEIYKLLTPFLGILVVFIISKEIVKTKIISVLVERVGKYTIGIYALHLYFFGIYSMNPVSNCIYVCFIAILFPAMIQMVVKNIPVLGYLLFGVKKQKKEELYEYF